MPPKDVTFSRAIARRPGPNFVEGLTTSGLGRPIIMKALEQHERYCETLEACGLEVTRLEPDLRHPDAPFVEDAAILTPAGPILTRPGAPSRRGEVKGVRAALAARFRAFRAIEPPATLDGGDVCRAGNHFFIGVSERTSEDGASQLGRLLEAEGFTAEPVDIRAVPGLLHLKSGIASLGDRRLALVPALLGRGEFAKYDAVPVDAAELYAANCIRVNDRIIVAAGYPKFTASLKKIGYDVVAVDVSEYRKMDGGLSCLSLRF